MDVNLLITLGIVAVLTIVFLLVRGHNLRRAELMTEEEKANKEEKEIQDQIRALDKKN